MKTIFTYPMLVNEKISYKQYIKNCYKRNKKEKCQKQMNGYSLCDGCPKLEETIG